MDGATIAQRRMAGLGMLGALWGEPVEVVARLLAVQFQEIEPATWSVAMRTPDGLQSPVSAALADGRLLRTHLLRPTWHVVAAEDIGWLLELTAPRVHQLNGPLYRQFGLDAATLDRTTGLLLDALRGGIQLTRVELADRLADGGYPVSGLHLGYVLMYAELERAICSGAPRGKQQTYAAFDDRVPPSRARTRDEAMVELIGRALATRGPASLADLQAWSSLALADLRAAVADLGDHLTCEEVDGHQLWSVAEEVAVPAVDGPLVHLLQPYDEYAIAYRSSRQLAVGPTGSLRIPDGVAVPNAIVTVDGQLVGHWRRRVRARAVDVEVLLLRELTTPEREALEVEAGRYAASLERAARTTVTSLTGA